MIGVHASEQTAAFIQEKEATVHSSVTVGELCLLCCRAINMLLAMKLIKHSPSQQQVGSVVSGSRNNEI